MAPTTMARRRQELSSSGAFSFTIKGAAAGTRDYRAVVSDFAGYLQFGYSAARALKVS